MSTMLQLWHRLSSTKKMFLGSSGLIILGAIFVFAFIGLPKQVQIEADGQIIEISTRQKTVAGVLAEAGIALAAADLVEPELDQPLAETAVIKVERAFPIHIQDGEQWLEVVSVAKPVAEVLALAGITLSSDDIIYPELTQPVDPANNRIEITRVSYQTEVKENKLPFPTQVTDDPNALEGTKQTVQAGQDGLTREEYLVTLHNGQEVARELIKQEVVQEPVPRIVSRGTKPKVTVASRGEHNFRYRQVLNMEASAYTHTGRPTATGIMPHVGIAAVDPKVIPLGTELYVDGYGFAKAADIGSAIRGNKIDLFFDSRAEALRFGRKSVKVYVLE